MAGSRKRVSAALFEGSGCLEQTLVAKRMRSATDTNEAKEPRSFCDIAEEQSSHTGPAANQEVDGRAGSNATTHSKQLFLLDLFCGTAGVAAAFRAMGGEALGIDHIIDKRRVKRPVAKVDLSKQDGQATVLQWIEEDKVDAVMLAPPCGTASRAREIPVPKRHKLRKGMQPVPLRSEAEPMGLSSLRGVAKIKVLAANKLYAFARKVMDLCERKGIPFICENPRRSLMWMTDPFLQLPGTFRFQHVHSCMYGGKRKKRTSFLMNFHAANLLLECDESHPHLPWGMVAQPAGSEMKFSTSLETEYPNGLCRQLALAFIEQLQRDGKNLSLSSGQIEQEQRMGSGLQPRGARAPLLVGDFKFKIDIKSTDVTIPASIEDNVHAPFQGLPLHSKLISSRMVTEVGENGEKKVFSLSSYGVFRSPWEFLDKALTLEHPLDSPHTVDKSNLKAMVFIRDHTKAEVLKFRAQQLRRYTERAAQLSSEENQLKNSLDPDVRRVLEGKRLLLFKEMAADAKVGDEHLFTELIEGFKLTGQMPESKQFPARLKPAMISVQQLKDSSVWAKKMIHASCRRVGADPEIARAVYEETIQQRADGWVKGPYTSSELDQKFDGCWIPSKRFGVRQGGKIRAVDDFSEFLVNASVTATEKLQLFGLDEVVNTARTFLGCDFLMMDDELDNLWCSERVRFFTGPWRKIFGRALDLKSAYKQLARHPADSWAAILAVWNDDADTVEFYESVALPFGSVCAVMAFNRMAKALRLILSELFMVINTIFFDDFCQLECEGLCDSAWETAEFVMKLLGWRISMSEDKRSPFAGEFNLLGAVVDLTRSTAGLVAVHNKPSRIADLQSLVQSICQSETVALSLLETLKGRLLYAAGHTFGRCSQLAIQLISRVARRGPLVVLDEKLKEVINAALLCLMDAKPRHVSAWSGRPPLIIFTDGACEEDGLCVTHGAAYYDPESHHALMFGDYVPTCWTDKWRTEGKKQLICQAELFPVLVAKNTWSHLISGRAVLWFIDNNSSLAAVIRSYSPVLENYELLVINARLEVELQAMHWYTRVPSKSNLSDDPSRLQFSELEAKGFKRCSPRYDLTK